MLTLASLMEIDFTNNMDRQTENFSDDDFFARRPEMKSQEQRDEELKQILEATTGFVNWDEEEKLDKKIVVPPNRQRKLDESPMFTDKRYQQTIASRKTSDFIMNNVATSNNAAYITVIKQEEETTDKSERQKKKERRAGCSKSSYAWDLKGNKILNMEDSKNKLMSEAEASRHSPKPRVEQTTQTEVCSVSTETQASVQYEEAVSVKSDIDGVELIRPYQNMAIEVKQRINAILTEQFEKNGLQQKGWTPLFGINGEAWYSVSFVQGDKIPDFSDADEIKQLLAGLNLKDTIAWGLRRIQPYIAVSSTVLDRWQVTLEILSQDELERESQMVRFLLSDMKLDNGTPPPSVVSEEEVQSPMRKKLTLRQKMRRLFEENPEAIVNSPKHGKITVAEWFKLQHVQRKEKVKAKKTTALDEGEVLRQESKPDLDDVPLQGTSKQHFSDDSIPKEIRGSLKDKLDHRKEVKQKPDKVLGQRKWETGKGLVKDEGYATVLKNDLEPSKQLVVFRPVAPIVPVVVRKRIPRCPIPGLPQRKWREERLDGKTEEELNEIAKQLLRRMIRSEVRFLRGRWLGNQIRERNAYLVRPEDVIAVVESNPRESQWESFKDWQTAAKEVKPTRGTEAQMNWSAYVPRQVDSDTTQH